MKRIGYRLAAAAMAAVLAIGSSGCRVGDDEVTISRGMADDEVFLIDGKVCTLPVMKLLLLNNMNLHGESYGIDLLQNENLKVQKKFEQYIKKTSMDEITRVYSMAALAGACLGFLPYNMNPAKIFMGDTGSMFLGYILATVSIQGLFKFYAVISFAVPFILLGLPIFDTGFAIVRRLLKGQSPLQADRGHVHHRLIDLGFDQKQSVAILYAFSALMGLTAVILARTNESKLIILAIAVLVCFFLAMSLMSFEKRHRAEEQAQLERIQKAAMEKEASEDTTNEGDPS